MTVKQQARPVGASQVPGDGARASGPSFIAARARNDVLSSRCTKRNTVGAVSRAIEIGGSLLSSEGPAFEVYLDAAPRVRVLLRFYSTDLLKPTLSDWKK